MNVFDIEKNGYIDIKEAETMLIESYHSLKIEFIPNQLDILGYLKVLDVNNDGRVTAEDIE